MPSETEAAIMKKLERLCSNVINSRKGGSGRNKKENGKI